MFCELGPLTPLFTRGPASLPHLVLCMFMFRRLLPARGPAKPQVQPPRHRPPVPAPTDRPPQLRPRQEAAPVPAPAPRHRGRARGRLGPRLLPRVRRRSAAAGAAARPAHRAAQTEEAAGGDQELQPHRRGHRHQGMASMGYLFTQQLREN